MPPQPLTEHERQERLRYLCDSAAFVERMLLRHIQVQVDRIRRLECENYGLRLLLDDARRAGNTRE